MNPLVHIPHQLYVYIMLAFLLLHLSRYEQKRWIGQRLGAVMSMVVSLGLFAILLDYLPLDANVLPSWHGWRITLVAVSVCLMAKGCVETLVARERDLHNAALWWGTPSFVLALLITDPLWAMGWHAFYWHGPWQWAINYELGKPLVDPHETRDWHVWIAGERRNLKIFKPLVGRWRLLAVIAGLAAMTWSYIL